MKPDTARESQFCLPHLHSAPPLGGGGSRRNIAMTYGTENYTVNHKKLDPFSFEHNFRKYYPILIIILQLQTEIICPQINN